MTFVFEATCAETSAEFSFKKLEKHFWSFLACPAKTTP